jgi:ribosome-binding protein aMBF1 (putative translation factor)
MMSHVDFANVDMSEAAVTMAIAVLADRIRTLPKEDREDLSQLSKALFEAETKEEEESAARAMREILEQAPVHVRPFPDEEPGPGLKQWMNFIGGRIKDAREKADLTQMQLAERSGLPQSHISRLENGQHSPSFVTLSKIALALKIPISDLDPSAESDAK